MKQSYPSRIRTICICMSVLALIKVTAFAADYSSGVTSKLLIKSQVTSSGQRINYPATDKAEVTALTVELAPGAETGWHKHPVPVYAYVISGDLSVELEDGKRFSFRAGEAVIEVVNTFHNGTNRGTEPLKLAVFYLGVEGSPTVIKRAHEDKNMGSALASKLAGSWKLVSFHSETPDGVKTFPFGKSAQGRLIYEPSGRMAVQLMDLDRPKFSSGDPLATSESEVRAAFGGYTGYYGTYSVNPEDQTITHTIEAALLPNWAGTSQKRQFEFDGKYLTLKGPLLLGGVQGVVSLVWERLP